MSQIKTKFIGANQVTAAKIGSGAATSGYVLTADGSGNSSWAAGGGGGGSWPAAIAADYYGPNNATTGAATITYQNLTFDTNSAYSTSTGQFTVPTAGKYRAYFSIGVSVSPSSTNDMTMKIFQSGTVRAEAIQSVSTTSNGNYNLSVECLLNCSVSDTIYATFTVGSTAWSSQSGHPGGNVSISYIGT